jgi:alpha-amylase/alpha-mannosidase (GH57 family)
MSKSMASKTRTKKVVLQEQKKVMAYDTDYPSCSIYICTSENHRDMWKGWKDAGWPIFSSWIDDKEVTAERRIYEARVSKALVLWYPDEAVPFEVLYEVGADTRLSNAEEADVVAIWSTPEMAQKAIVLPWPNGAELAARICEHIDASMIAGYIKGGGSSDS